MLERLVDALLPPRCAGCGEPGAAWCEGCLGRLALVRGERCRRCGAPTALAVERCRECRGRRLAFAGATCAVTLDAHARAFMRAWKDRGLDLAPAALAAVLACERGPPQLDALCPVPAERDRVLRRGVDGPARLAALLGRFWEVDVRPDLLVRTAAVRPQRGLDASARRRNLAGAFAPGAPAPARVGLVDDVLTTGATADACARALRRGGARVVEVVAFARAVVR